MVMTDPRRSARRRRMDSVFRYLCLAAVSFGVILLAVFLVKIVMDGYKNLSLSFIQNPLSAKAAKTGIGPAVIGSLAVMALTAVIAVPIGVAAAIYLEEFNQRKTKVTNFIQLNIANLAGVPSIVYGLLGLAVFVRWLALEESMISGALTMSLLILPMVIIVTQEALKAVPRSYRDASLALGSTPWQAIRYQVLPNAASGIFTGIILSISRAIGETAPLIVVGAVSMGGAPKDIFSQYTALPIKIFDWSLDPRTAFHEVAASAILVLMITLLLLNSVAIFLRARSQARR